MNGDVWPAPTPEDENGKSPPLEAMVMVGVVGVAVVVFWLITMATGLTPPTVPTVEALK